MRVDTEILTVLSAAEICGRDLRLPGLDRCTYLSVDRVLKAAGGRWDRGRRAHVFEVDASSVISAILVTGEVSSRRREFGQFFSPPAVVAEVMALARVTTGESVLEPSAGRGALALAALTAGATVDCVEIDPQLAGGLYHHPFRRVFCADFLAVQPEAIYDAVIANPPFAMGQDVAHVGHALRFLRPGGRLVAILSASVLWRRDRAARSLREQIEGLGGRMEPMPPRSFAVAGTTVETVMCSLGAWHEN